MSVTSESIFNLIPKPKKLPGKKDIYRSKYDPKAPLTGSTFGLHGTTVTVGKGINDELKKTRVISSTFGPKPKKADPSNFLRRGSQTQNPKQEQKFKRCSTIKKPPVPLSDEKPIMGLKTSKNFIVSNATEAIIQEPKKTDRAQTPFMEKETYGKIPKYIERVKRAIHNENEIISKCVQAQTGGGSPDDEPVYEEMNEQERYELICALKKKWGEVNSHYQKICHRVSIDSLGDKKRKEAQEMDLEQLEEDISRLSRPGPLYILKS